MSSTSSGFGGGSGGFSFERSSSISDSPRGLPQRAGGPSVLRLGGLGVPLHPVPIVSSAYALPQTLAKVQQLQARAYHFLWQVLSCYRTLKSSVASVEQSADTHRRSLDREALRSDELKAELEASLECMTFLSAVMCKAGLDKTAGVKSALWAGPAPGQTSPPPPTNLGSPGSGRGRPGATSPGFTDGAREGALLDSLLRFPRPSVPTERFMQLASRLVHQRRQAGPPVKRPPTAVTAQPNAPLAHAMPSNGGPCGSGIGFSNLSLLGLTVHCAPVNPSPGSSTNNSAPPQLSVPPPSSAARAISNQELSASSSATVQQYSGYGGGGGMVPSHSVISFNPATQNASLPFSPQYSSGGMASGASNNSNNAALSHGFASHQNLKSMFNKPKPPQPQQQQYHPQGRPILQNQQQQQRESVSLSTSVAHTPVQSKSFAPPGIGPPLQQQMQQQQQQQQQQQLSSASPQPNVSRSFVLLSPSDLLTLLPGLPSDDLLLLHRRFSEDVHACVWSALLAARQRRDLALSKMTGMIQEREELSRASLDAADIAHHYKKCLDLTQQTLQGSAALVGSSSSGGSSNGVNGSVVLPPSIANSASGSDGEECPSDPAAVLELFRALFPHSITPQRSWSELVRQHGSTSAAAQHQQPQSQPLFLSGVDLSIDLHAAVSLLSELIEWHRRLIDHTSKQSHFGAHGAGAGTAATLMGSTPTTGLPDTASFGHGSTPFFRAQAGGGAPLHSQPFPILQSAKRTASISEHSPALMHAQPNS